MIISPARTFIQSEIASHQVVAFTKSWCGYCRRALQTLEAQGGGDMDLVHHHLDHRSDGNEIQNELYRMTGLSTVPNIFINGKSIGGNDALQRLHQSGQLKKLLAERPAKL